MIFLGSVLFAVAIFFAGQMFRPFSTTASQPTFLDDDDEECGCFDESRMHPLLERGTFRIDFGSASSCTIVPSTGGFYLMACDGVELEFLGLSGFGTNPRAEDPVDEDHHCARMRKLGATLYSSDWNYSTKHNSMIKDSKREDPS
ncbi:hypothetical protein GCG54_00012751 [Colletotrichum gloeosporioides]|uniref:Transmembrane protein n=1 Tax=Colletotrichum gloeosporioides TaxID=474922 RepID=A0A8H4CST0_COLGL|nr:uncharacterized protein GCG54_00012751 [Colletotrichum gloeosporioides]KAF3809470.1 hypothetical protein GCG54_00012751 [Colletotrichum gloeosporioides]